MDVRLALNLLKAFPACHLRIFKQLPGIPDSGIQINENGYEVFVGSSISEKPCFRALIDFVESSDLSITSFGHYLMIYN
jgi:hypothetical protein